MILQADAILDFLMEQKYSEHFGSETGSLLRLHKLPIVTDWKQKSKKSRSNSSLRAWNLSSNSNSKCGTIRLNVVVAIEWRPNQITYKLSAFLKSFRVDAHAQLSGIRPGGMILYEKILASDLVSEFFHIKSCLQSWCQKAVQQPFTIS